MDALENDLESLRLGLAALQRIQSGYDAFGWNISEPPFEKFRHIAIHLGILSGELMKACEGWEHNVWSNRRDTSVVDLDSKRESIEFAIANCLFHAAQFANLIEADAFGCLTRLYGDNARMFAPASEFAKIGQISK